MEEKINKHHLLEGRYGLNRFGVTEKKSLKAEYIKATFIYDELKFYHNLLHIKVEDTEGLVRKYQYVKGIMLPLSLLSKNLKAWSLYSNKNEKLIVLQRVLREKLEFANHIRNKITGHLENEVLGLLFSGNLLFFTRYPKVIRQHSVS